MAHAPVTVADFITLKHQFSGVDTAVIQSYLDVASLIIDDSWPEAFYRLAIPAFTCHLMTIEGLGTDAASTAFAAGFAGMQSIKSGSVTLTRMNFTESVGDPAVWLSSSPCGAYYLQLLRMVRGGPRVAMGATGYGFSAYAKDFMFGA